MFELNTRKIINYNIANWIERFNSLIRNKYTNFELEKMNFNNVQAAVVAHKSQTIVYLSGIPFR